MVDRKAENDIHFVMVDVDKTKIFTTTDGADGNSPGRFDQAGDFVYQPRLEMEKLLAGRMPSMPP